MIHMSLDNLYESLWSSVSLLVEWEWMEQPGEGSKKEEVIAVAASKGRGNRYLLSVYYKMPDSFLGTSTHNIA